MRTTKCLSFLAGLSSLLLSVSGATAQNALLPLTSTDGVFTPPKGG